MNARIDYGRDVLFLLLDTHSQVGTRFNLYVGITL